MNIKYQNILNVRCHDFYGKLMFKYYMYKLSVLMGFKTLFRLIPRVSEFRGKAVLAKQRPGSGADLRLQGADRRDTNGGKSLSLSLSLSLSFIL